MRARVSRRSSGLRSDPEWRTPVELHSHNCAASWWIEGAQRIVLIDPLGEVYMRDPSPHYARMASPL